MPAAALPLTNDLRIEQGATFELNMTLEQPAGTPFDLTNKTLKSQIKRDYTDAAAIVDITATITSAVNGQVTLSLTAAQTATITAGSYVWDLIMTDNITAKVTRVLEGPAEVTARVTT